MQCLILIDEESYASKEVMDAINEVYGNKKVTAMKAHKLLWELPIYEGGAGWANEKITSHVEYKLMEEQRQPGDYLQQPIGEYGNILGMWCLFMALFFADLAGDSNLLETVEV